MEWRNITENEEKVILVQLKYILHYFLVEIIILLKWLIK